MVKVLSITIRDRNFIFCFAYCFVRASVHVYFVILSPVFLELGRLIRSVSRWFNCFAASFHQAMKPILSIVYVECRTWKMYINTLVAKTEKMVSFIKTKRAIESNSTTKCRHLSKQDVCFSIQSGNPLTTRARGTKAIDIPGYLIIDLLQG